MRRPTISPPVLPAKPDPTWWLDLEIDVITPMWVGRHSPDPTPAGAINVPSIRGNLRYWWRACNAARFETLTELRDAEAQIWGHVGLTSKDKPKALKSLVQVNVELARDSGEEYPLPHPLDPLAYALFPFRSQGDGNINARPGWSGVQFRLRIGPDQFRLISDESTAKAQRAVAQAVWAWLVFGGVGARTRRGCGTLRARQQKDGSPLNCGNDVVINDFVCQSGATWFFTWLGKTFHKFCETGEHSPLVTRIGQGFTHISESDIEPTDAWEKAVSVYRDFRQANNIGRNSGFGQSRWPEPSAIRSILEMDAEKEPHEVAPDWGPSSFPRADLGLPIKFQYLPGDPTLQTQHESGRFASPVITKAVSVHPNQVVPMIAVLESPHIYDQDFPKLRILNESFHGGVMTDEPFPPFKRPPHVSNRKSARDAFDSWIRTRPTWRHK